MHRGEKKTAQLPHNLMDTIMDLIEAENVVQVVTDNEASFKKAEKLLQEKYPCLVWAHMLPIVSI